MLFELWLILIFSPVANFAQQSVYTILELGAYQIKQRIYESCLDSSLLQLVFASLKLKNVGEK